LPFEDVVLAAPTPRRYPAFAALFMNELVAVVAVHRRAAEEEQHAIRTMPTELSDSAA
jgi:hypothetical protein